MKHVNIQKDREHYMVYVNGSFAGSGDTYSEAMSIAAEYDAD